MKHCRFFFQSAVLFFPFFPFFLDLVPQKKRDLFVSVCLFLRGRIFFPPPSLAVASTRYPHHRNKKMFALTTQFAGVQVVSKTAAPKKSVNKVVSVRVFDCLYIYFDALSRALLVFAERFLCARVLESKFSLDCWITPHESEIPTRARAQVDRLLTNHTSFFVLYYSSINRTATRLTPTDADKR